MRVMKYMALALAFLLLVAYLAGYFLPDKAHVERSIDINRSPADVFAVLNSPQQFNRWSPWYEANKKFGTTYSYHGPDNGVGASIRWQAANIVSAGDHRGEMKITASRPHESVVYALLFENREPAITRFDIKALPGNRSRVTWSYDANFGNSVIGRYFGLILDRAVGPDYEAGLRNLRTVLEDSAESPDDKAPAAETTAG